MAAPSPSPPPRQKRRISINGDVQGIAVVETDSSRRPSWRSPPSPTSAGGWVLKRKPVLPPPLGDTTATSSTTSSSGVATDRFYHGTTGRTKHQETDDTKAGEPQQAQSAAQSRDNVLRVLQLADVRRLMCRDTPPPQKNAYYTFASQSAAFAFIDAWETRRRPDTQVVAGALLKVFSVETSGDGGRKFVVASQDAFWSKYLCTPPAQRHFYEIIRASTPCNLYFDLEFYREANPDVAHDSLMATFRELVKRRIKAVFGLELLDDHIVELDSTTPAKFSRHWTVHLPNRFLFSCTTHVGQFVGQFLATIAEQRATDPAVDALWLWDAKSTQRVFLADIAVYTKYGMPRNQLASLVYRHRNRAMRMLLSSKFGKDAVLQPVVPLFDAAAPVTHQNACLKQLWLQSLVHGFWPPCFAAPVKAVSLAFDVAQLDDPIEELLPVAVLAKLEAVERGEVPLVGGTEAQDPQAEHYERPSADAWSKWLGHPGVPVGSQLLPALDSADSIRIPGLPAPTQRGTVKLAASTLSMRNPCRRCFVPHGGADVVRQRSPFSALDEFVLTQVQTGGVVGSIRSWSVRLKDDSVPAEIATMCPWALHPSGSVVVASCAILFVSYSIANNRWCQRIGRPHRSNHIVLTANLQTRRLTQSCMDPECRALNYQSDAVAIPASVFESLPHASDTPLR